MENLAPERTETRERVARVSKLLAGFLLDLFQRRENLVPHCIRKPLAGRVVFATRLGRDRETRRNRQAGVRHLGKGPRPCRRVGRASKHRRREIGRPILESRMPLPSSRILPEEFGYSLKSGRGPTAPEARSTAVFKESGRPIIASRAASIRRRRWPRRAALVCRPVKHSRLDDGAFGSELHRLRNYDQGIGEGHRRQDSRPLGPGEVGDILARFFRHDCSSE